MRHSFLTKSLISLSFGLGLTGCGFSPVHAPVQSGLTTGFQNITIETVKTGNPNNDEGGFFLKQRLRDRLGTSGGDHILRITPKLDQRNLGFSGDDIASRNDLTLTAYYELVDGASGDILDSGNVRSVSSFGVPLDAFGQQAAQENATRTLAQETADRLLARLARFYSSRKN